MTPEGKINTPPVGEITQLLALARDGDPGAIGRLYERIYAELHAVAARNMAREPAGHTLQPTALVHEAWIRLGGDAQPGWENRAHFFGAASEAMRRILVDRSRRKLAQRRGERAEHVEIDGLSIATPVDDEQLIILNDALDHFSRVDASKAELVKLRYFVGLTLEQAATVLNISEATAKRWWAYSRAWLYNACRRP